MDLILEFILELILEGSIEILQLRKVPMLLRFLAGLILGIVYGGLLYLGIMLTINGISSHDWALAAVGIGIVALIGAFAVLALKKYGKKVT